MTKKFVLDTSVLLHDPDAIYNFEENEVIITREVMLEIDKKRGGGDSTSQNANQVIRNLKSIFTELDDINPFVDEKVSVKLEEGPKVTLYYDLEFFKPNEINKEVRSIQELSELKYESNKIFINNGQKNATDMRLVEICKKIDDAILVTKDFILQLFAIQNGVKAEDYTSDKIEHRNMQYKGYKEIYVEDDIIDKLYEEGGISPKEYDLTVNQFVEFKASESHTGLGYYNGDAIEYLSANIVVDGVKPLNREQVFAFKALMNNDIELVTLEGPSGTGKTLLSLAVGLDKVQTREEYKKLVITRPIVSAGNDIGYLPGTEEEKLRPWMKPIYDNMDYICEGGGDMSSEEIIEGLKSYNKLEIEALQYIRGRSMPGIFFIVDEAQNLTPSQIKTLITRAGEDTKIVLTGDTDQIDKPFLSKGSNALTYIKDNFKGQDNYGHVNLHKTERSRLAEQASKLL